MSKKTKIQLYLALIRRFSNNKGKCLPIQNKRFGKANFPLLQCGSLKLYLCANLVRYREGQKIAVKLCQ
jgi:hypothetical protein